MGRFSVFFGKGTGQKNSRKRPIETPRSGGKAPLTTPKRPADAGEKKPQKTPLKGAARAAVARLSLGYLLGLHRHMAREALLRLMATPVASFMSCLMIALAFTLPTLFYVLVTNVQQLGEGWGSQPKISLYLSTQMSEAQRTRLQASVRTITGQDPVYISPEQGLRSFQDYAGIAGVAAGLGFNPLPGVMQVAVPEKAAALEPLLARLQKLSGVDRIRLDQKWVQRLLAITGFLEQLALVLALLLGLTIWLSISNTIGLSIAARQQEIQVVKLVGGTDGFIMLPFLYTGLFYGLGGGLLAVLVSWGALAALMPSVMALAGLYGETLVLSWPGGLLSLMLVLFGGLLGVLGALASCCKHLRKLEAG